MTKTLALISLLMFSTSAFAQRVYHPDGSGQSFTICADSSPNICQTVAWNDANFTVVVALGALSRQLDEQQASNIARNAALATVIANQVVLNAKMDMWMKRAEDGLRQSIDDKFKGLPKELVEDKNFSDALDKLKQDILKSIPKS